MNLKLFIISFILMFTLPANAQLRTDGEGYKISQKINKYFTSGCNHPRSMGKLPAIEFYDDYGDDNTSTYKGIATISCVQKRNDGSWAAGTGIYKEYPFIAIFRKRKEINEYIKHLSIKVNDSYIQIFPSN